MHEATDPVASARAAVTADLMTRTGLDDAMLSRLVHRFYDRVRVDPMLGPVLAERISDWGPHLAKMVDFWFSAALMPGASTVTRVCRRVLGKFACPGAPNFLR